jgi:hypothetical protein
MIRRFLRYLYRSAITGRFVSRKYAEEHPAETVKERAE